MITKYEAGGYPSIKKVEFVRETDKFLVRANGMRDAKTSSHISYFDTLEEARDWLIGNCREKIESYQQRIQTIKADISAYESIKEGDLK